MRASACCERERKKKRIAEWKQRGHVSITNILVYTPAVDKHLLCLACRPLQPQNAWLILAFMLMQHLAMWEQGSISIDSHSSRPAYGLMGHDRIIAAQYTSCCHSAKSRGYTYRLRAHIHTRQGDVRKPWSESHRRCEVCVRACMWLNAVCPCAVVICLFCMWEKMSTCDHSHTLCGKTSTGQ